MARPFYSKTRKQTPASQDSPKLTKLVKHEQWVMSQELGRRVSYEEAKDHLLENGPQSVPEKPQRASMRSQEKITDQFGAVTGVPVPEDFWDD